MTESKTESAARRGGLAWQKARRILGLGSRVNRLPDWPDALTPAELAALQYPREGTDPEKRKALSNQRAMVAALDASIQAGELGDTFTLQREIFKTQRGRFPGMEFAGQWIPASSYSNTVCAGIKEFQALARNQFASWLDGQGEEPSEHIRAWLGPEWAKSAPTRQDPSHYFEAPPVAPLPRVTMLMMEAGDLAGFDARNGWPDAFTPKELAALQYPDDKPAQGRLIAMLAPRLDVDIPAVGVEREGNPEGAIERAAAARFLDDIGEEPSRYVMAWLESEGTSMNRGSDTPAIRPNEYPPIEGDIPPRESGRLATKAAWEIECEVQRHATDVEVMARLKEWGKKGAEDSLLDCDKLPIGASVSVQTDVKNGAIPWQTKKGEIRAFTLQACQKALEKWRKSRQQ